MRKRLTATLATLSGLIPRGLYPRLVRRNVIDFFWHAVSDDPMPHVQHLYPVVSTRAFEAALRYLKANYHIIDYPQLHAHRFEGAPLPPKAVHLSFDDGYAECFNVVRPLLLKHGIPCTFFLTTSLIDNPILFYRNKQSLGVARMKSPSFNLEALARDNLPATLPALISWFKDLRLPDENLIDEICEAIRVDWRTFLVEKQPYLHTAQIQQMCAEGFTMGAHTVTHRKLVDLPDDEIEAEITQSCQIVREISGQEIIPFSFPHSAWGLDRGYLGEIRERDTMHGLFFDTKGLHPDVPFMHNRIWAERPLPEHAADENGAARISAYLYAAYQEAWVDEMMAKGRRLRG